MITRSRQAKGSGRGLREAGVPAAGQRSEEHTSELQSQSNLVCRLLLEKKKKKEVVELQRSIKDIDAYQHLALAEPTRRNALIDIVASHSLGVRHTLILSVERDAVSVQV